MLLSCSFHGGSGPKQKEQGKKAGKQKDSNEVQGRSLPLSPSHTPWQAASNQKTRTKEPIRSSAKAKTHKDSKTDKPQQKAKAANKRHPKTERQNQTNQDKHPTQLNNKPLTIDPRTKTKEPETKKTLFLHRSLACVRREPGEGAGRAAALELSHCSLRTEPLEAATSFL